MRVLAVCQTEVTARLLDAVLSRCAELEVVVEDRALGRRLQDAGLGAIVADPQRLDTYVRADVSPATCVIVEDAPGRGVRRILQAARGAGALLLYLFSVRQDEARRHDELRAEFPEVTSVTLADLAGDPLVTELSRSVTRQRVQQYQRYFSDADRVLILLHHDPDPDAIASGLALRTLLRRTRQTAIIGSLEPVSRPENQRMLKLLDIQLERLTPDAFAGFDKIALVDVQPHYFGDLLPQVDLVIDHHPPQSGYAAVFSDIRPDFGSTSTILTDHLRAVGMDISERTATAMLYAIKSDTLFFTRQANRADLDAFSYLYPLADATLIRRMEGADITRERLDAVIRAWQDGVLDAHIFCACLGEVAREDFIPYVADFYLQLEDVQWTVVGGFVRDQFVLSVRNLGYSRNAGDLVRRWFGEVGNAGGHRTMAKAVLPRAAFEREVGRGEPRETARRMLEVVRDFLHEGARKAPTV